MIATILPEIEQYLAAQERFEMLRKQTQLQYGRELSDLGYANAWDGPPPAALNAIREALDSSRALDLQYTPYGGTTITRRLVATGLATSHGLPFDWREIVMTPGAMAALNVLFRALKTSGRDEVIIVSPCWIDYPLYLANLGIQPVFASVDPTSLRLDLGRIAAALTPRTRAIVLSQPANPSGLIYTRAELEALAALLKQHSGGEIMLISDECHRDMVYDGNPFVSPAEVYDNTCLVYSFGKRFFMQGQRTGYAAVSPRAPQARALSQLLERLCRIMGFCTPTALMQLAARKLLEIKPDISGIVARRTRILEALTAGGYEFHPSQATFFIYPCAPGGDDEAFAARIASKGVLVLPASVFHHTGFFRVSLTAPDDQIERAATALLAVGH